MAEQFITYTKHGVAESTLLKATKVGHHYNLVADVDIDNGSVAKIGKYTKSDLFKADIPAVGDKIVLILTAPKIYSEYTTKMQEESNFFNAKGDILRVYELYVGDVFTLSADGFDGVPEVNKTVSVSNKKVKVGA